MTLTQTQCFFALVLIAAVKGYSRGWGREIISSAITLAGILFLLVGGGRALEQFFFVTIPQIFRGTPPTPIALDGTPPNPMMDLVMVLGFAALGYLAGEYFGAAAKTPRQRLAGLAIGTVTGLALLYYVTRTLLPSTTIELTSPSAGVVTSYLILLFGFGLMLLLIITLVKR